ncbi:MAG: lipopolysaccharide heptosyltransferase II, partial [Alphaproteobacteria bacterium]|nr:lipopolysaccharide heptosyltransferase II [Alphaproteobacteria bacterium]
MRALVVAPNWIGDAVMAQPLLARLKSDQPERALDWLAPAHILAVGQAIPEVDRLIEAPQRHGKLDLTRRWQLAHRLRRESYAQAFILPNSAKSALIPWLAQIPVRIGYRGEMRT